jgi:Type II secretion system (T2SS), protein M subtype b
MRRLKTLASKTMALGLLGLVLAGLALGLVQPLAGRMTSAQEQLAQQRALLGRLIASVRPGAPSAITSGAAAATPQAAADIYLNGDSDAARLAGLQSRVDGIAQKAGTRLSSTQVVAPRDANGIRLVGIETQLSANLDQLQQILFELETQKPYLLVESLHVTRAPDAETVDRPDLDVRLVIAGAAERKKG